MTTARRALTSALIRRPCGESGLVDICWPSAALNSASTAVFISAVSGMTMPVSSM